MVTPPTVEIGLSVVDQAGNQLTEVRVGESLTLSVHVEDLRTIPKGVFAAYLDVTFDPNRLEQTGYGQFAALFSVAKSFDYAESGVLDELGGASASLRPLGGRVFELFSIELTAMSPGPTTIQTNPADDVTTHDILVYGVNDPVDISSVNYGQLTINVVGDGNISAETSESEPLGERSSMAQGTEYVTFRRFCAPAQPSETQEVDSTFLEASRETQASEQGKDIRELGPSDASGYVSRYGGGYTGNWVFLSAPTSNDSIWTARRWSGYSHSSDILSYTTYDLRYGLVSWSNSGIVDLHRGPGHDLLTTINPLVAPLHPLAPSETSPNTNVGYSYALTGNNSNETLRDLHFLSVVKHSSDTQPAIPVHASLGIHAQVGNDKQRLENRVDRGSIRVTKQLAEAVDRALDQILDGAFALMAPSSYKR